MEESPGIRSPASLVPVRRRSRRRRRGPPRHVSHASVRPRRIPPGDRGGLRRRPHPRRDRIVLHTDPSRGREAPRAPHGGCLGPEAPGTIWPPVSSPSSLPYTLSAVLVLFHL